MSEENTDYGTSGGGNDSGASGRGDSGADRGNRAGTSQIPVQAGETKTEASSTQSGGASSGNAGTASTTTTGRKPPTGKSTARAAAAKRAAAERKRKQEALEKRLELFESAWQSAQGEHQPSEAEPSGESGRTLARPGEPEYDQNAGIQAPTTELSSTVGEGDSGEPDMGVGAETAVHPPLRPSRPNTLRGRKTPGSRLLNSVRERALARFASEMDGSLERGGEPPQRRAPSVMFMNPVQRVRMMRNQEPKLADRFGRLGGNMKSHASSTGNF